MVKSRNFRQKIYNLQRVLGWVASSKFLSCVTNLTTTMNRLFFLLFFITTSIFAQSNTEIANIYLIKSEENLAADNVDQSLVYFEKAKKLFGKDTSPKVEQLGTMIYYNLEDFEKSKEHAKRYFTLEKDKKSEKYQEILYLFVELEEKIEEQRKVDEEIAQRELLREKEENRLDSLKNVWLTKANDLLFEADSIYAFDKNGIAVFKSVKGYFGVVDVSGSELVAPNQNSSFSHFDGYVILKEGFANQSTKITVLNTTTKQVSELPSVKEFNNLSTHYGKVMLPRENGVLVTYPNNSTRVAVYNLNSNTLMAPGNMTQQYDLWKRKDAIKKYNKQNQIKIEKEYLNFGGNLSGFSAFYNESGVLDCFISVGGNIFSSSSYSHIGTLTNGFVEVVKPNGNSYWIDENGNESEILVNKNGTYEGAIVLNKKGASKFHFINENNEIIKGNQKLVSQKEFLKQ